MAGGEQHRGRVRSGEQVVQALPGCRVADVVGHLPARGRLPKLIRERLRQAGRAERGRGVGGVAGGEQVHPPPGVGPARLFRGGHGRRVRGVFGRSVEVDAAHGVRHVQLVLERERDLFGAADDQEVVGDLAGIGRRRANERQVILGHRSQPHANVGH